jgi:hypothetical protein
MAIRAEITPESKARFKAALSNLRGKIKSEIFSQSRTNWKLAKEYSKQVKANIIAQNYKPAGLTHSKKYIPYKRKYGVGRGKTDWWTLFNTAYKSLSVWKTDNGFKSGIPSNIYGIDEQGKATQVAMYASILEKKYPIFEPTLNDFVPVWEDRWFRTFYNICEESWK